jgi:hypothetical protein
MTLDPDKVRQAVDKAGSLTKRVDAFLARRAKRDADKAQRKADRARRDAERLDPVEEALKAASPDAPPPLTSPDSFLDQPRDLADPWYYSDLQLGYEREELRQGALSKNV